MSETRRFLTARWMHLAMLNYEVDPAVLAGLIPVGTELDTFGGKTFASMVGFSFLDTRLLGVPVPFHRSFEEVNLRFYVRRRVQGQWRRAVVFVREFVPKRAVSLGARLLYNENYKTARMSHAFAGLGDESTTARSIAYCWRHRGSQSRLELCWDEPLAATPAGSEEQFIAEHYWGCTSQRDGQTKEYEVEHPAWLVARARESRLHCDVAKVYGERFVETLSNAPSSVFYAAGSAVKVYPGTRIET